jgi:hypothetical protein
MQNCSELAGDNIVEIYMNYIYILYEEHGYGP